MSIGHAFSRDLFTHEELAKVLDKVEATFVNAQGAITHEEIEEFKKLEFDILFILEVHFYVVNLFFDCVSQADVIHHIFADHLFLAPAE